MHIAACIGSLFYRWVVFHCIDVLLLFIHSPAGEHLGCVQFLVIMIKADINISIQIYVYTYVFISFG